MSEFLTITDKNYKEFIRPVVDGERKEMGLIPRDFGTHPQGCLSYAKPFDLNLIDEAEWPERIRDQERLQSSLQHIRNKGMNGQRIPSTDQNGKGYCWAHSTVSATLLARASANLPFADLSAYAIACIIKSFQDRGGWGLESVEFIAERGCPTSQFWPQKSMSRANDNPQTWENARKHRITEWMDLSSNKELARKQLATCLLLGYPVVTDLNWWTHSIASVRLVSARPFTVRIWNSWGDSWGSDFGMSDLVEGRAIPDGALAIRVPTAIAA